jgi:superfamily II DNA or RNA helicase
MPTFRLPVLEPDVTYIGASLFLPKSLVAEAPIRTALTFGIEAGMEPRTLVRRHPHHLEVPRNYLLPAALRRLGIDQVVDLRPPSFTPSSLAPKPGFALRPNQHGAWLALEGAAAGGVDGGLRLDTGKGKTVLGLRYACIVGGPVLVVSAQEAHLRNWETELRTMFDMKGPVGWVLGDQLDYRREVVFSTIQTLVKRAEAGKLPDDFHSRFALTIYDEAHHQAAEWFARGSDLTMGQRLWLTATLKRRDRCEGIVLYHLGPVLYDDPSEDSLVPSVHLHETGTVLADDDPDILDVLKQPNISKLRGKLGSLSERNQVIVGVVQERLAQGHKVYVLSHSKKHVYELVGALTDVGILAGGITGDEKGAEERLRQLNNYPVVVATLHVGKENYNRPDLSALVMTTPLSIDDYAPTEWVQSVGRILRPLKGKLDPVVDLFADREVHHSFGMLQSVLKWCRKTGWLVKGDTWTRTITAPRTWRA